MLKSSKVLVLTNAFLAVLAAGMVSGKPAFSANNACANLPEEKAEISVVASFVNPTFYKTLARSELTKKSGNGLPTYGVTETTQTASVQVAILHAPDNDNAGVCFALTNVEVAIRLDKADVYIASELKPGSCAYRVTMEHEKRHVAIARMALKRHTNTLAQELKKRRYRIVRRASSKEAALTLAKNLIDEPTNEILDRIRRETDREHGKLDTPENYKRTSARCKKW